MVKNLHQHIYKKFIHKTEVKVLKKPTRGKNKFDKTIKEFNKGTDKVSKKKKKRIINN